MNILHFKRTMRAEDGGVVKAVLDLCAMSAASGHRVTLATSDPSAVPIEWQEGRHQYIRPLVLKGLGRSMDRLSSVHILALKQQIDSSDVVHLHSMWSGANIQVANMCIKSKKPYVLSVHGMLDDWCMSQRRLKKVVFLKTVNRRLLRNAGAVHCTAEAELRQAEKWIPRGSGRVAPLPLDLSEYIDLPDPSEALSAFPTINAAGPKVLFLSRIHHKKGLDRLIRASATLHERGFEHQLIVAGTGEGAYPQQMRDLCRALGIDESTHFVGFVSGRTKIALLSLCDVFALPTSQENFGFVYFESLASGTPVITTRGTDTWPELTTSGGGVIVDNDPQSFADAIIALLGKSGTAGSMGRAGRRWVFDNLGSEAIASTYERLYREVIAGGNA